MSRAQDTDGFFVVEAAAGASGTSSPGASVRGEAAATGASLRGEAAAAGASLQGEAAAARASPAQRLGRMAKALKPAELPRSPRGAPSPAGLGASELLAE